MLSTVLLYFGIAIAINAAIGAAVLTLFGFLMGAFGIDGAVKWENWLIVCANGFYCWPLFLLISLMLLFDFTSAVSHPRKFSECFPSARKVTA